MFDEMVLKALRERYPHVHPLMFQRSMEKSKTQGELFDLLETISREYPIVWCEEEHVWKHTQDLLQSVDFTKTQK